MDRDVPNVIFAAEELVLLEPINSEGALKFESFERVMAPAATVGSVAVDPKRSPVS
jgi:hypothetical protein